MLDRDSVVGASRRGGAEGGAADLDAADLGAADLGISRGEKGERAEEHEREEIFEFHLGTEGKERFVFVRGEEVVRVGEESVR